MLAFGMVEAKNSTKLSVAFGPADTMRDGMSEEASSERCEMPPSILSGSELFDPLLTIESMDGLWTRKASHKRGYVPLKAGTNPSPVNLRLMDAPALASRFLRWVPSPAGKQGDVLLVEPNGDEHVVRCLVKGLETEIGGDGESLAYLNSRYGDQAVCLAARGAVMAEGL